MGQGTAMVDVPEVGASQSRVHQATSSEAADRTGQITLKSGTESMLRRKLPSKIIDPFGWSCPQ